MEIEDDDVNADNDLMRERADQIIAALKSRNLSYTKLARVSGISRHTITMIAGDKRKFIRKTTVAALHEALVKMGFINVVSQ